MFRLFFCFVPPLLGLASALELLIASPFEDLPELVVLGTFSPFFLNFFAGSSSLSGLPGLLPFSSSLPPRLLMCALTAEMGGPACTGRPTLEVEDLRTSLRGGAIRWATSRRALTL